LPRDVEELGCENAFGRDNLHASLECGLRIPEVGHNRGVGCTQNADVVRDGAPGELILRTVLVDESQKLDPASARAQRGNLTEIADSDEDHARPAALRALLENVDTLAPGIPEEIERRRKVLRRQRRFFGEALGCQITGVAVLGDVLDLD